MGSLDGQVAFITGAGRGQGRAHALALAREGAHIVATDFEQQLETVTYAMNARGELGNTGALVEECGVPCLTRQADVRDFLQLERIVSETVQRFGRLDILVANAGMWAGAPIEQMGEQLWRDTLDVNLTGTFNAIRAVVPTMLRQRRGRIVAIASIIAKRPVPGMAAYAAAKSGVLSLVETLSIELGPHGITVNALCPSIVKTGMTLNPAFNRSIRPDLQDPSLADVLPALDANQPNGDAMAEMEDVSSALLYLVSPQARLVTGAALDINPVR